MWGIRFTYSYVLLAHSVLTATVDACLKMFYFIKNFHDYHHNIPVEN
jgi:hypothetical protein